MAHCQHHATATCTYIHTYIHTYICRYVCTYTYMHLCSYIPSNTNIEPVHTMFLIKRLFLHARACVCVLHCWLTSSSSLFPLSYAYSEEVHQKMALRTWLNVVIGTVVQLDRSVHYSVYTHTACQYDTVMWHTCILNTQVMCNMYVHACVCTYVHMHNTYVCM